MKPNNNALYKLINNCHKDVLSRLDDLTGSKGALAEKRSQSLKEMDKRLLALAKNKDPEDILQKLRSWQQLKEVELQTLYTSSKKVQVPDLLDQMGLLNFELKIYSLLLGEEEYDDD